METVGKFKLKNKGGFVAKMKFVYLNDEGNRIKTSTTGDIPVAQSQTISPEDLAVPNNSILDLYVVVVAGSDQESDKMFHFDKNSRKIANFEISGTTLHNSLTFNGISDETEEKKE